MTMSVATAQVLLRCVERMAERPEECARSPGRDLARERKLGPGRLLLLLVCWAQETMGAELCDLDGWDGEAPTPGALTQQWKKLSDRAMPALLRLFLSQFEPVPFAGRYRLLAADGTEWQLLPGTGGDRCRVANGRGGGHHWEMHATCAFDLFRRTFEDVECQGGAEEDEPGALCRIVDRFYCGHGLVPLWLADRAFCSWNVLCHMAEAGASFCLRASDDWVAKLFGDELPEGPFDVRVRHYLVRSRSAASRSFPDHPGLYSVFTKGRRLDVLAPGSPGEYAVEVRVVRVALPARDGDPGGGDRWLNLVTDLSAGEFGAAALADLYSLRWGEETGFLHLKHAVGLGDPRTRDFGRAVQELWGKLVLYDACSLGASGVPEAGRGSKHQRRTDRTHALKAFARMFRKRVRREAFDVEACAARASHSVRRGRSHERRKRPKSPPRSQHGH